VLDPDFAWRFGDIVRADLIVSHSGIFFSDLSNASGGSVLPLLGPTDAVATGLKLRLTGGDYFGRMEWVLEASGTNSTQSGFHDKRRSVTADLEYHIDRNFGVIANLGYREYNTQPSLTRGISGPVAMAGFTFRANETFTAVIKAGTQYQFTSVTGNVRYQFSPTSQFFFALDDIVTTPQDRLLLGLNGVETFQGGFYAPGTLLPNQDALAGLLDTNNGQPINLLPLDGLALDNIISRYRTATAGLIHRMPRTTLNLTAYGTVRDYLLPLPGFDLRQTIYGINVTASRELRRDLTGSLSADYSVAHEFGGIDKLATISAFLNYMISEKWSANLRISYLDRQARTGLPFANGPLSNVQAGVGVRYNF
jgi:hypothetical protein